MSLSDRHKVKTKDMPITIENTIHFTGGDIDIVEQIPDDTETIEKTLAYAKTLSVETYEKAKKWTKQNQAARPIRAVKKWHDQNLLSITNNNGPETSAL